VLFAASLVFFATERTRLWEIFAIMAVTGVGTGCLFAVMPRMIVAVVPGHETSSALALNQVLRSVGYSIGSATGATVLAAHTAAGQSLPSGSGYTVGAWIGVGLCLIAAVVAWTLPAASPVTASPVTLPVPPTPSGDDRLSRGDEEIMIEESTDAAIAGLIGFEPDPDTADSGHVCDPTAGSDSTHVVDRSERAGRTDGRLESSGRANG